MTVRAGLRALATGALLTGWLLAATGVALPQDFLRLQGNGVPGQFDFYVLSLSWSPGFCDATGDARGSAQCEAGRKLGFVVHGLWPQYDRGYPSNCSTDRGLPARLMDEAATLYPDANLARHEWRMHGSCSGLTPADYLKAVAAARRKVTIPEPLQTLSREGRTSAQSIERAFTLANPGLRPDMMAVICRRGGLQEVRVCLSKDLSGYQRCPEIDRAACRFGPVRVSAPR